MQRMQRAAAVAGGDSCGPGGPGGAGTAALSFRMEEEVPPTQRCSQDCGEMGGVEAEGGPGQRGLRNCRPLWRRAAEPRSAAVASGLCGPRRRRSQPGDRSGTSAAKETGSSTPAQMSVSSTSSSAAFPGCPVAGAAAPSERRPSSPYDSSSNRRRQRQRGGRDSSSRSGSHHSPQRIR